jgi:hypothetical protein
VTAARSTPATPACSALLRGFLSGSALSSRSTRTPRAIEPRRSCASTRLPIASGCAPPSHPPR